MPSLRLAALALATALAHTPASADADLPPFSIGAPTPDNHYGLALNQWYVFANSALASTVIDGSTGYEYSFVPVPSPGQLSRSAEHAQAVDGKLASAFARVAPFNLGTSASAIAPLDSTGSRTLGISYSTVMYFAVLDTDTTLNFDLRLHGQLATTGDIAGGDFRSGAAVAAFAAGSERGGYFNSQPSLLATAGLGAFDEGGEPLLRELVQLKPSTQTHLDVFGAQSDTMHRSVDIDTTLHVSVGGTQLTCDGPHSPIEPPSPACGRYFYGLGVMLFNAAQNGGVADFSHSLQVTGVSINGGPVEPFNAISPVPEPTSALLLALGLGGMAVLRRTRR